MEFRKTEGLTIKCSDYRESSQILTVYTHDYGKLNIIARGIRRLRNDLEGPFDILEYIQVVYIHNPVTQMNILTSSKIYDNFLPFHYDYKRLKYGVSIIGFLNDMTVFEDSNPRLFQLALGTMRQICMEQNDTSIIFYTFQIRALKFLGYLPYPDSNMADFMNNIPICNDQGVLALVRNLADAKTPLRNLRISPEMFERLSRFLNGYISHIIDREVRVK